MKVYDLEGNLISNDNFTIGDNQVYISKSTINQELGWKVREYVQNIHNSLKRYDADAKEIFTLDLLNEVSNSYDINDFSSYVALVSQWYSVLQEKYTLFYTVQNLNTWQNSLPSQVVQSWQNISQELDNETPENINNSDWAVLKIWVDENVKPGGAYEQYYYHSFAEQMCNMAGERLDELNQQLVVTNDLRQVVWAMRENHADAQDFAVVKDMLLNGTYREIVGYDLPDYDQRYMPNFDVIYDKIYYKNYAGLTGELEVVGYFDLEGVSYVYPYLLSDNFRRTYSQLYDGEEEYTWKYIESTEYEEPADAKYNFIIRLTDNSQEQIAEALTGGKGVELGFTNSVYQELQFFLEMITELEQIFLIIGIVMGVFSALMLLNFISVSISAKRKDIGILRAVGARGSDVFKIFFAEAFIIAFICFMIAAVGAYVVCDILNSSMVTVVSMKLLNYQPVNVGLIFAVSFGIAIIATFFPVYFAAKKSPVESIRAL